MYIFLRLRRQGKAPDSQQVLNLAKLADSRFEKKKLTVFLTVFVKVGITRRDAKEVSGEHFRE